VIWACTRSPYPNHTVLNLEEAPVIAEWIFPLDSIQGIGELYRLFTTADSIESAVLVCHNVRTKKRQHYLLNFDEYLGKECLTINPIDGRSYFFNLNEYLSVQPSGDLLSINSIPNGKENIVQLNDHKYFGSGLPPVVLDGQIFLPVLDLSYNLRNEQQNELFFKETSPIIALDSTFQISGYFGSYPPDYIEKRLYGYHLSPYLDEGDGTIYLSFPGSRYIGKLNLNKGSTIFSEFVSAYDKGYQPMDTSDFMKISKAIQFQDTASRYTQVGYSGLYEKIARIYFRHKPIEFNKKSFHGSIVVGNTMDGKVEMEYLFANKNFKHSILLILESGVLKIDYVENSGEEPYITFKLLNIFNY
jgi:hypothetical protein